LAAVSSFYPDPGELNRAIEEAELVLDVITSEPQIAEALEEGIAARPQGSLPTATPSPIGSSA
jgi:hypothetical protein